MAETWSRTAGKYGYNFGVLFDFLAKAGYSLTALVESNSEELLIARIGPWQFQEKDGCRFREND
jgi:hypothetical protein